GSFIHLVLGRIGDEQEFIAPFAGQGEAVGTGKIVSPAGDQLATGVVYQEVVFGFVGEQQDAPAPVLHHLMAVVYRVLGVIEHTPALYLLIGHTVVAIHGIRGGAEGVDVRRGGQCRGGRGRLGNEGSSVHIKYLLAAKVTFLG